MAAIVARIRTPMAATVLQVGVQDVGRVHEQVRPHHVAGLVESSVRYSSSSHLAVRQVKYV